MHELSTHLSPQLSPQPHFLPFFRPRKQNEKGTFGQHFFCLQLRPFNGSFNTPLNACPAWHHVAHERPPYTPSHTLEPPKYAHFHAHTHMSAARHTPAPRRKPHKAPCRLVLRCSLPFTTHKRKAARRAVFSGHAQRLHAVDASSVRCAQLKAQTPPFPAVD